MQTISYQKLIFLVEENPLVKDFKDVEEIIGKLFGYREIKEISREERKESFNFGHGGRNQSYLLQIQETRIYKKVTVTENKSKNESFQVLRLFAHRITVH